MHSAAVLHFWLLLLWYLVFRGAVVALIDALVAVVLVVAPAAVSLALNVLPLLCGTTVFL